MKKTEKSLRVLGIETSCDDTGVAIYDADQGLLAHQRYSQTNIHQLYGGVVPELASRDHLQKLLPLIQSVIQLANISSDTIQGVAYTAGPGLVGALMVGASVGRSLGFSWSVPTIGVHHMEGHLLAPLLEEEAPAFPFLALLVSGGHTLLVHVKGLGQYDILGQSVDDAAGEAFDKTAKLLNLPYPGGPELASLAEQGNSECFHFPRPMTKDPGLDFSFSGLKTAALNTIQREDQDHQTRCDIARCFEDAVVDTLMIKVRRGIELTKLPRLVIAGGVSANQTLRKRLNELGKEIGIDVFFPRHEFCTDNGAMIAYAGCLRLMEGEQDNLGIAVHPRWSLEDL